MTHRVKCRLAGRSGAEGDGPQHGGQETQLTGLGAQLGEVEVAGWPDNGVDLLQRCRKHRARHDGEGRLADDGVLHRVVHQHAAGLAKLKGSGVKVADGAQPGLFADLGRVGEQGGDNDVEQVEHVVLRRRFQRPHEGDQRRHAPLQRHPRHGLRFGDGREPGECRDAAGRHMVDRRQARGQKPHLVEPADGAGQFGAAAQVGAVTQAIKRTGAASFAGDQQGIKLRPLLARHVAGESAPEPARGPGANAGYQALQGRRPRQEHLLYHRPGGRAVEQHARPVCARPAQGVEPASQAEVDEWIRELAIAEAGPDFSGVLPADPALAIQGEASRIGYPKLTRHIA